MSTWYVKAVGAGIEAASNTRRLFAAFQEMIVAGSTTPGMSVFSKQDRQTGLQTWWFSPAASALAATFEAQACKKPKPTPGLAIAVSTGNGWQTHFPDFVPSLEHS